MKEIKFRAWHEHGKRMVYGPSDGVSSPSWVLAMCSANGIEPMQYTGLKDLNGNDIYEGDIHKLGDEVGAVEYHDGTYFVLGEYCTRFLYQELTEQKGEVIGNIYENPDLITKEGINE